MAVVVRTSLPLARRRNRWLWPPPRTRRQAASCGGWFAL